MALLPPSPGRNLPRAPVGPWNQEFPSPRPNSNQMARVENHCARLSRAGNWRLRVPGVCAVPGEDESISTPPQSTRAPWGPGAPSQSLGDAGAPAVA